MDREVVRVASMPATNPTYSQAIKAGGFLFLAGQIGLNYATGRLVSDDVRGQTHQMLENVRTVLEAAGSSLEQVVNVTVYITNWDSWAAFNEVYGQFFPKDGPAKTSVEVSRLFVDASVEIQAVALA